MKKIYIFILKVLLIFSAAAGIAAVLLWFDQNPAHFHLFHCASRKFLK
ncbi:MAG: hypothetical protein Q8865_04900 [Bacillota bacterium]|nr:hypothetical protein [Bacillota bacterium]